MSNAFQAKSIIEISGSDYALVPIIPAGTIHGWDGRGPYHLKDAKAVIAASARQYVDLAIDRDHAADLSPAGTAVPAAGWIKGLVEKDGGIFARVEWTPPALAQLDNKEYRYISPTFRHTKDGTIVRIDGATLTNRPNFDMKSVASINNSNPENPEEENLPMNKTILAIAAALGLAAPETEEAVLAKVTEVAAALATSQTSLTDAQTSLASTAKALGLPENEKAETIVSTAAALKADKAGDKTDPQKFVPMEMFQATASALKTLQDKSQNKEAEEAVEKAQKAGKVTPAMKDWALGYAKADPKGFATAIDAMPVVLQSGETNAGEKKPSDPAADLSEEEKSVATQLGISHEEFKKAR